ncbi:hypothetical protein ABW636_17490 [Aquimarina sp. 2201CG1-2-11]|uniref:hypothetical protein n=1 Tax=Aquimarina discodermiae TaxID=3231043 RepID=UPI0034626E26
MLEQVKKKLQKKHIVIVGKSKKERRTFINSLIEDTNLELLGRVREIQSLEEYASFIKKSKMYHPQDLKNDSYPPHQDVRPVYAHHSWIKEKDNTGLMILEELDNVLSNDVGYILRTICFLIKRSDTLRKGEKGIRCIISMEKDNDLIEKLMVNDNTRFEDATGRTKRQLFEQNIEVIDISNSIHI